uniref:Lysosome-associated membrane glycoprotein 3-like n=1 Tax=Mastacembelus armatus TaxID=205130 RepID=A0A3Q3LVQ7_9TELE
MVITNSVRCLPSPGISLQRNDSSVQLVLQPSEASPPIGDYILKSLNGNPCIKATMGAEYIITEQKKTWYFNLDPSRVRISGYCDKEAAVLSLTLPDDAAGLQFTFKKEKSLFYVSNLTAHVSPVPVYKTYSGLVDHDKLFMVQVGQSFSCKSESLLSTSSELKIKLVPLQIQAFTQPSDHYGQAVECWADFNKRIIPIILEATVVGLILITVLTFLFIKDRRRQGYDRI